MFYKSKSGNDNASDIAQNPMRLLRLGDKDTVRRAMPPAPWEVGEHNPEKDREKENKKRMSLSMFILMKEGKNLIPQRMSIQQ